MADLTPMMRQYLEIKEQNKDSILFFRLGDFYEMFNEDAKLAARELDLVLTTRDRGKSAEEQTPMCGIPYHSSDGYIARLIAKGYKVAICEQTEDPALAKGLVKRDIIRVVTPGTVIDSACLDDRRGNFLCGIFVDGQNAGAAFCDMTTGHTHVTAFSGDDRLEHLYNELSRFSPAEAVLSAGAYDNGELVEYLRDKLSCAFERGENHFELKACEKAIRAQFGEEAFASLPRNNPAASLALGALLSYLHETQKTDLSYIKDLEYYEQGRFMELDLSARRNLELTESLRDFCRLQMLSTLQRDPKNLDLKTDLMVEFTVGGMLAVLQRWPELSDTIEIKDLLKEDVAVLAMGIYLAMSQKDMLNYWNRIFVHNAQDSTAPGMPVAATHAAPSTISSSNGPAGFPGYTA